MTEQLMDNLTNEEHEALLLMSEHAIASPLSPAAKAVAWAYDNAPEKTTGNHRYHWIAAALRAVADQVVPFPRLPYDSCCDVSASAIRAELLGIAAELKGLNE